jgi:hypothetical protein
MALPPGFAGGSFCQHRVYGAGENQMDVNSTNIPLRWSGKKINPYLRLFE